MKIREAISGLLPTETAFPRLDRGWIIANHKLVSFHAAFLTSLISISEHISSRAEVLREMFFSVELVLSTAMWYAAWHANIAVHEMGHYLAAVKTNNLRPELAAPAQEKLERGLAGRLFWYLEMFVKIPWGAFPGVTLESGSYHPSVKAQNLAVSAAGPRASRNLALAALAPGVALIAWGRAANAEAAVYAGRFLATIGVVALFDFFISDPGKYAAYNERLEKAAEKAREAEASKDEPGAGGAAALSSLKPGEVKRKLEYHRLQEVELPNGKFVFAPWEFRNSIMGGRHTEDMGGNLSFQEFMFLPLTAKDYIEAQRVTNALQSRVIQILQDSEGLNFVGIGLEGGVVASYAKGPGDLIPEERALQVAVQAIKECGFVPERDVALAIDSAASELSIAYREETGESESIGQYRFWRAEDPKTMTTDELVELYKRWIMEYPIVSIEDAFAEDDHEGWKTLMKAIGDDILIIGDDLVTTKDSTIVKCADEGLINTALIKANQIGTMSETLLATRAAKSRKLALVVSHRSKSPNEVMEADIGFAVGALGLKCGGGSNTERLIKYGRIVELIGLAEKGMKPSRKLDGDLEIVDISAHEEPTNAGIPTVGVAIRLDNGMKFTAATPLGTSAGMDEAVHLVDSIIEESPTTRKHPRFFTDKKKDGTYRFKKEAKSDEVLGKGDEELTHLWLRAQRYNGKGCLNAVRNVVEVIAPSFLNKKLSQLGDLVEIDRELLRLELDLAQSRGKIAEGAPGDEKIALMQRKANLGMNAVLSCSLALGRLLATKEGIEFPELLRDLEPKIDRDFLYGLKEEPAAPKPEPVEA